MLYDLTHFSNTYVCVSSTMVGLPPTREGILVGPQALGFASKELTRWFQMSFVLKYPFFPILLADRRFFLVPQAPAESPLYTQHVGLGET